MNINALEVLEIIKKQDLFLDNEASHPHREYDDICEALIENHFCPFKQVDLPEVDNYYFTQCCETIHKEYPDLDVSWCSKHTIKLAKLINLPAKDILKLVDNDYSGEGSGNGLKYCAGCYDFRDLSEFFKLFGKQTLMRTE